MLEEAVLSAGRPGFIENTQFDVKEDKAYSGETEENNPNTK